MKIRTGFVSNSSSSSFVLVGVKLTIKEMEYYFGEEWYEDDLDHYTYDDYVFFGETVNYFGEEGGVKASSEQNITDAFITAKRKMEQYKIDKPVKLYSGTVYN